MEARATLAFGFRLAFMKYDKKHVAFLWLNKPRSDFPSRFCPGWPLLRGALYIISNHDMNVGGLLIGYVCLCHCVRV